jgi:predicted transcriptional regulator
MAQTILEMAKDLVLAQIEVKALLPEEMLQVLRRTHAELLALKAAEEAGATEPGQVTAETLAPGDWRSSITRHTIVCLECGAAFKQLSVLHLREHGLDARSYRAKYGIPRTQPLSAKATAAKRRQIVRRTRPWEKAPTYRAAHATPEEPAPPPAPAKKRRPRRRQAAPKQRRQSEERATTGE